MIKQILLPVGVLVIFASMLLPLPTLVLDFLLVSNLILAMTLLISSMYISDPLKLSSLPTILLLSTLYRLALNISTTRLILGTGDAGRTVEAFGSVVIQGNIVVGMIVFIIITLVQFIVIAKGSERVAEVSARFTLDAMPGKQMSIDADVRAGLLDFETAKKKRDELQTESRFYGALDGAMKFIKGDAIAGIIVCAINLVGGLIIGLVTERLDLARAISKYSILTVGDGLVSQIPALLSALAAGLVVTRVVRGDGSPLATEVIAQLGQIRMVKILIGVLCIGLSLAPGIPALPFAILGLALLISSRIQKNASQSEVSVAKHNVFVPRTVPLLQIAMTKDLAQTLRNFSGLNDKVDHFRQEIFEDFGLILLRPDFAPIKREGLEYKIFMRGVEAGSKRYPQETKLDAAVLFDEILVQLKTIVANSVHELVDDVLTRRILDFFDKEAPELVSSVVPAVASVNQVTFILKSLLNENIPVRNFDLILQAIADCAQKQGGERVMLEEVRVALKRVISDQLKDKDNCIHAYNLDPLIDLNLVKSEKAASPIETDHIEQILQFIARKEGKTIIMVCSKSARKLTKECLDARGANVTVLAYEEIASSVKVNWQGSITFSNSISEENALRSIAA